MTQGIVSIRADGEMMYKIVVGHDGMNAHKVARRIGLLETIPTVDQLKTICNEESFGCPGCLIILERDPERWSIPIVHAGPEIDWDNSPDNERYLDTFRVAQFNPRWKYGTADYVEVVNLPFEYLL